VLSAYVVCVQGLEDKGVVEKLQDVMVLNGINIKILKI
jgi:hypothetical protein